MFMHSKGVCTTAECGYRYTVHQYNNESIMKSYSTICRCSVIAVSDEHGLFRINSNLHYQNLSTDTQTAVAAQVAYLPNCASSIRSASVHSVFLSKFGSVSETSDRKS